ncbi:MAG: hypothetical protein JKY70_11665 [Mucilaginibacter sp.]|nr:hypothetical protein [Mucilaginibacter sp.]
MEGAVAFKTEAGATLLRKGDLVSIPLDGGVHCFENTTTDLATLLCTFMPAGLEKIFYHLGEPVGPDEFLALPERSKGRDELHKALDLWYNQKTFPRDHLDI